MKNKKLSIESKSAIVRNSRLEELKAQFMKDNPQFNVLSKNYRKTHINTIKDEFIDFLARKIVILEK